jgi:hypothetical protein
MADEQATHGLVREALAIRARLMRELNKARAGSDVRSVIKLERKLAEIDGIVARLGPLTDKRD